MAYEVNGNQAKAINHKHIVIKETWMASPFATRQRRQSLQSSPFSPGFSKRPAAFAQQTPTKVHSPFSARSVTSPRIASPRVASPGICRIGSPYVASPSVSSPFSNGFGASPRIGSSRKAQRGTSAVAELQKRLDEAEAKAQRAEVLTVRLHFPRNSWCELHSCSLN